MIQLLDLCGYARKHFNNMQFELLIDRSTVQAAQEAITDADSISVFGYGGSKSAAFFLEQYLLLRGRRVKLIKSLKLLSDVQSGDLLILLTASSSHASLVDIARIFSELGGKVLVVTLVENSCSYLEPFRKYATIVSCSRHGYEDEYLSTVNSIKLLSVLERLVAGSENLEIISKKETISCHFNSDFIDLGSKKHADIIYVVHDYSSASVANDVAMRSRESMIIPIIPMSFDDLVHGAAYSISATRENNIAKVYFLGPDIFLRKLSEIANSSYYQFIQFDSQISSTNGMVKDQLWAITFFQALLCKHELNTPVVQTRFMSYLWKKFR